MPGSGRARAGEKRRTSPFLLKGTRHQERVPEGSLGQAFKDELNVKPPQYRGSCLRQKK